MLRRCPFVIWADSESWAKKASSSGSMLVTIGNFGFYSEKHQKLFEGFKANKVNRFMILKGYSFKRENWLLIKIRTIVRRGELKIESSDCQHWREKQNKP